MLLLILLDVYTPSSQEKPSEGGGIGSIADMRQVALDYIGTSRNSLRDLK